LRAPGARLAAVHEASEGAAACATAGQEPAVAGAARDAAEHALDALHRRRLAGYSSELARKLVAGEPCAVCGSTEHPAPAEPGDAPVTPESIDDASAARDDALSVYESAAETRREAE